jgi:hypothetical protein
MCLMPVHQDYGIHTGRYGPTCNNSLTDCMKPFLIQLFHKDQGGTASQILQKEQRPTNFAEFWSWLWVHNGDHIYGILKVLDVMLKNGSS